MIKHILLPLDGSDIAEQAIPYAQSIARKTGSSITLMHVCAQKHKDMHNMHKLYITKRAELLQKQMLKNKVSSYHTIGDTAEEIQKYVAENDIELVIMTAHGAGKFMTRLLGSFADDLFRLLSCSTMLIRPTKDSSEACPSHQIKNILVPLDGTKNSELALPIAEEIALKTKASITLFHMVSPANFAQAKDDIIGDMGQEVDRLNAAKMQASHKYLHSIRETLREKGINAEDYVTSGSNAAKEISKAAKHVEADLKIMATRGHLPITAWAPNSIAHQILNSGYLPLILVKSP